MKRRHRDRQVRRVVARDQAQGGRRARAIGCLIYSDPADDGYAQGDVYPKGPYAQPTAFSAAA
ncbi:MAG: hypothetical protein R2909_10840 [Gemmatimonadales bacterium]